MSRRRDFSQFKPKKNTTIDYKDLADLRLHISESARIIPARISDTTASTQRSLAKAVKLARFLALLPYCDNHD